MLPLAEVSISLRSEWRLRSLTYARRSQWKKVAHKVRNTRRGAANLGPKFSFVSPEDLYSIRCGVLHQDRFGDLKHNVARVLFLPPECGSSFTNCQINDAYCYSVVEFCRNLCDAAHKWYEANRNDPIVQVNSRRMMQ